MEFYREGLHLDKTKYNSPNRKYEWVRREVVEWYKLQLTQP